MAKKTEATLEDKLRALYDLQLIDSRVDEIRNVRGELPLEVEDLENEIAGVESRLESFQQEVSDFDFQTKEQKNKIEVAKEEHKKYEQNLKNVRNNRQWLLLLLINKDLLQALPPRNLELKRLLLKSSKIVCTKV